MLDKGQIYRHCFFNIFNLEDFLRQNGNINGVFCASDNVNDTLYIFLKVFVLLYADDTVIIAESAEDLQNALTAYASYCETWKLLVNSSSKTKVVIFFQRPISKL